MPNMPYASARARMAKPCPCIFDVESLSSTNCPFWLQALQRYERPLRSSILNRPRSGVFPPAMKDRQARAVTAIGALDALESGARAKEPSRFCIEAR